MRKTANENIKYMDLNLNPDFIIEHVSLYLGTCKRAVLSNSRRGAVCDSRQISMYFSYKFYGSSYREIGEWFNRSQWDVRHHVETCIGYMKVDDEFEKKIKMVERHLISQRIIDLAKTDIQHELVSDTVNKICI